jgi:hypothetical protein
VVDLLLERGASVECPDEEGCLPHMVAAERGDLPTLARLVQRGAPLAAVDHRGFSALLFAVAAGQVGDVIIIIIIIFIMIIMIIMIIIIIIIIFIMIIFIMILLPPGRVPPTHRTS